MVGRQQLWSNVNETSVHQRAAMQELSARKYRPIQVEF